MIWEQIVLVASNGLEGEVAWENEKRIVQILWEKGRLGITNERASKRKMSSNANVSPVAEKETINTNRFINKLQALSLVADLGGTTRGIKQSNSYIRHI